MQWQKHAGNITTDFKVKIYFNLTSISLTNVVTCKCHVDESSRGRYSMNLGRYIWTELGLNLNVFEHFIESDDGRFIGYTAPMVYLGVYIFKYLNIGEIEPKEYFTDA